MFPRPLSQCFYLKRRFFCQNQHIFVERLPIDFFYFEDFRWSIFGKIIGQKKRLYFKISQHYVPLFGEQYTSLLQLSVPLFQCGSWHT